LDTPQHAAAATTSAKHRPRGPGVRRGDGDPREGHAHPGQPDPPGPLPQHHGGEHGGEDDLDLEHERGQPGRHPGGHPGEEQAELGDAEGGPDPEDPLPGDFGRPDEEDGGQRGGQEAQGGQQQRREVAEPDLDDGEVDAPDSGDEDGEGGVNGTHAPRIGAPIM
jgi:hypothetical protein